MRKVVFEGTINGKTFDNVQDYNNEMQRLLGLGETNIQASSNTCVTTEPEPVQEHQKALAGRKLFNPNDFLPFFNDEAEQYYLDLLVSADDVLNEKNLNVACDMLDKNLADLAGLLRRKELNLEDAFGLVNVLKEIRSKIYEDSDVNRSTTQEVTERISADTAKLKLLSNAKPVITTVSDYYDRAFALVKDYLLQL